MLFKRSWNKESKLIFLVGQTFLVLEEVRVIEFVGEDFDLGISVDSDERKVITERTTDGKFSLEEKNREFFCKGKV